MEESPARSSGTLWQLLPSSALWPLGPAVAGDPGGGRRWSPSCVQEYSSTATPKGPPVLPGLGVQSAGAEPWMCLLGGGSDVWTPVLLAPLGTHVCSREELGAAQPPRAAPQELGTEPPS